MHDYDKVRITYRIGDSGNRYIGFRFVRLMGGDKIRIEGDDHWFTFDWAEYLRVKSSFEDACSDGYHMMKKAGSERWMFFDVEIPRDKVAKREITIRSVDIPHRVATLIERYGRLAFRKIEREKAELVKARGWSRDEHEIELSPVRCERWMHRYGQGTGTVAWEVDPRCEALWADRHKDEVLQERLESLKRIALNGTWTKWQQARIRLAPDCGGFYFMIYLPDGRMKLNGVIIPRDIDEAGKPHEWSMHT